MQTPIEKSFKFKSLYALFGLFLFVLFFSALGTLFMQWMTHLAGTNYQNAVLQLKTNNSLDIRNYVRLVSIVSQLTTFAIPALLIVFFFHRQKWDSYLKINKVPPFQLVVVGVFFLFATFPFAQWLLELNKSLPLPDWAVSLEKDLGEISAALLVMESPWELVFNLFTIAVIPAIGEELLFRGVVQQKIRAFSQRPHFSVWLAAIIFSAFHGQFEGFLARLLLGAALGYLLYWTNNLWIPILAHFFTNAVQVSIQYFTDIHPEADSNPQISALLIILSAILAAILAYFIIHFNRKSFVQNRETSQN